MFFLIRRGDILLLIIIYIIKSGNSSNNNVYINLCSKKDCTYSATVNKASRLGYPDATYTIDIKLLERALEEPICKFSKND